jgi:hypothetical protein
MLWRNINRKTSEYEILNNDITKKIISLIILKLKSILKTWIVKYFI